MEDVNALNATEQKKTVTKKPILVWQQSKFAGGNTPLYYVESKVGEVEVCILKIELEWMSRKIRFGDRWIIYIFDRPVAYQAGTFADFESVQVEAEELLKKTARDIIYKLMPNIQNNE